jgi:single-strand DNA-binding protein
MILTGLVRVGNEPVLRYTQANEPVIDLNLAYSYGRQDKTGKKPTQWVNASLRGKRAESLAPYMLKGKQYSVVLSEVHVETFTKKDGSQGVAMRAKVDSLEFTDRKEESTPAPVKQEPQGGFNEIEDDIPF